MRDAGPVGGLAADRDGVREVRAARTEVLFDIRVMDT